MHLSVSMCLTVESFSKVNMANLYRNIFNLFSIIGFIPKTRMQMKIVAFVIGIIFAFTIAVYISFYFYFKFIESSEYVDFLTDLIFTCIGFLCPYLNFSMRSKCPDVFYKNDMEGNSINNILQYIYSLLFNVKDLHRRSYYFLFCAVDWSI